MTDQRASDAPTRGPIGPIAPWVQVPRLEAILGTSLTDLTWTVLEDLARRQVPEDATLEYKGEAYGNADRDKQEFCKDVAALANADGGLIVLGVEEDAQGRAARLQPLADLEAESRRLAGVLIGGLAPWVSDLAISICAAPVGDGSGALLVFVPRSDEAPHAVRRGEAYGWPVRQDRMTRWMREPEIAGRYRDRFRGAEDAARRADRVALDGLARLERLDTCWLAVMLTPTRAGRLRADRDAYRGWLAEEVATLPIGLSTQTAVLGRRRIVFTDQYRFRGFSRDHHVELHEDGSGFAAVAVNNRRGIADLPRYGLADHLSFDVDSVVAWTLAYLRMLAAHAVNAGGGGDSIVRAQLIPGEAEDDDGSTRRVLPLIPAEPFADASGAYFGQRIVPGSMAVPDPTPLEVIAPLSIATSAGDLVGVAAEITHELFTEFASVPTAQVLTAAGLVLDRNPRGTLASLIGWASTHDVLAKNSDARDVPGN